MTSLLGRLLPLFVGARRVEDLFTEAVARLFERRPDLCLSWLDELGLITSASEGDRRYIRVTTQKSFVALDEHASGSRPDLIVEVHHAAKDAELESSIEVVMIESKVGSWEGQAQLKRYAEHLSYMSGTRKTLVYITRAYDPKEEQQVTAETRDVGFCQLRWHDFYQFFQTVEQDALVEEVLAFMEEQGMARRHQFSTSDLMALSSVPRAFEIFDETLGDEVKSELESFAENRSGANRALWQIRTFGRYITMADLREWDMSCLVGYQMFTSDDYPTALVQLETSPTSAGRETAIVVMKKVALREDWEAVDLNATGSWSNVVRTRSVAHFLSEEDHVAAVKRFFVESIRQLREELSTFKQDHPEFLRT